MNTEIASSPEQPDPDGFAAQVEALAREDAPAAHPLAEHVPADVLPFVQSLPVRTGNPRRYNVVVRHLPPVPASGKPANVDGRTGKNVRPLKNFVVEAAGEAEARLKAVERLGANDPAALDLTVTEVKDG